MQDPYDSYGIRETEVAIEEFVNRLLELYPDLDPLRVSKLIGARAKHSGAKQRLAPVPTHKDSQSWI